jgi:hypothetical protein
MSILVKIIGDLTIKPCIEYYDNLLKEYNYNTSYEILFIHIILYTVFIFWLYKQ